MKKFLILLSVLISGTALADVNLSVDENIKVTAINGQEVRHNLLQPLKKQFTLQAGRHVITARYDRMFDLTGGRHDYLKSGNITVTADLSDNQSYTLTMPNQPDSYNLAKEYAKSPSLAITLNGNIIAQENQSQPSEGILSGLGSIFGRDKALQSNQQAIASLNQSQTASPSAGVPALAPATPQKTTQTAQKDNLDGFMHLWLNSSEEEREKIRQWVQK